MRIGVYYDNSAFINVDCTNPEKGNPGIGGTEFCFISLIHFYQKYYQNDEIIQFVHKKAYLPYTKETIEVNNIYEVIDLAKEIKIDILLIRAISDKKVYEQIDLNKVNTITWGHNFYYSNLCNMISKSKYVKLNVFVGKQMYDRYIDNEIINKSTYIYNIYTQPSKFRDVISESNVTYIGSIVPHKGFHILAKSWRKILREVPEAKLLVIGSGQLYNRENAMGKFGIAEDGYEKKFMKYLVDSNGKILDSVRFLGILGPEKEDVIIKSSIGIANPSGKTETFGLSALDFQSRGVPVVTIKKNGFLDTIVDKKTGLMYMYKFRLSNNVIKLLKNKDMNMEMGENGKKFSKNFSPEFIIQEWKSSFEKVYNNQPTIYISPTDYYYKDFKLLRILNKFIKERFDFLRYKSVIDVESGLINIVRKIKRK